MKSTLKWFLCVIALGAVAYFGADKWYRHAHASRVLNVRPYILERVDFAIVNGREKVTAHTVFARREDGVIARVGVLYHDQSTVNLRRVDDPNGFTAMISNLLSIRSSGRIPEKRIANHANCTMNPPAHCTDSGEIIDGADLFYG